MVPRHNGTDAAQVETDDSFQASGGEMSTIDMAVAHILGDYKRACDGEVELKPSPETFIQYHDEKSSMSQMSEENG